MCTSAHSLTVKRIPHFGKLSLQVYWENGAQITSPHDKEILKCIEECVEPWNDSWNENLVDCSPLTRDPLQKISASYMEDLKKICYHR